MSIRPVLFHPDGSIDTVFDETGHTGTIPAAEVKWSAGIDGIEDHRYIVLYCPDGCGASSTHPVGGGAAPVEVQQMFVQKTTREGCACGVVAPGLQNTVPESHVHLNVARMEGEGRWALG